MKRLAVLGMIGWLQSVALAAPPPIPDLQDKELAALAKGEVVIRPPASPTSEVVGVVDIQATPEQVWSVILDFPGRVESVKVLKSIDIYAPESDPKGLGASFRMVILGTTVDYHLRYVIDREAGYCSFRLDPEREHSIRATTGSYRMVSLPDGGQRVYYRSAIDTGRYVPGFIQKMLAQDSLRGQLEDMKRRAPLE